MLYFIDFETRSFADLPTVGAWKYSEDPSTDIISLYVKGYGMREGVFWTPEKSQCDLFLTVLRYQNAQFIARYALFDFAIMKNVAVKRYGFPAWIVEPDRWECTRRMCLNVGLPGSLKDSALAVRAKNLKLDTGADLIKKYSIPVTDRKTKAKSFREFTQADFDRMLEYNRADVLADMEVFDKIKNEKNIETERRIFTHDFKNNIRGIRIDLDVLQRVGAKIHSLQKSAEKRIEEIGVNPNSGKQMKEFLISHGEKVLNIQEATLNAVYDRTKSAAVKELIDIRRFTGRASLKKYAAFAEQTSADGRLRYAQSYYGAHTGRWTSKGVQLYNLVKPEKSEGEAGVVKAIDAILKTNNYADAVRYGKQIIPGLIIPDDDNVFIMGDFSGIEARGAAYLAGCESLLSDFREGRDPYITTAAKIFKVKPENVTPKQRQVGKTTVLGCGYGMGVEKFKAYCRLKNIEMTDALAQKAVYGYREAYPEIPQLWRDLENAFTRCLVEKGKKFKVGRYITLENRGGSVVVTLPSGRELYYHKAKILDGKIAYYSFHGNHYVGMWGGVLTENVTQAMCRDILVDCMLRLDDKGIPVPLHVYDEIVAEAPEKDKEKSQKIFTKITNTPPEWLPGFPLKTENVIAKRYFK